MPAQCFQRILSIQLRTLEEISNSEDTVEISLTSTHSVELLVMQDSGPALLQHDRLTEDCVCSKLHC